jgi:hypothetical protein
VLYGNPSASLSIFVISSKHFSNSIEMTRLFISPGFADFFIHQKLAFTGFKLYIVIAEFGGLDFMLAENREKIHDLKRRLKILGDFL